MKKFKKKKLLLSVTAFVLLLLMGYLLFWPSEEKEYMQYASFYQNVKEGKITTAELTESQVIFTMQGEDTKYYTENPEYDQFREFLLLHQVQVTSMTSSDDILYSIMDLAFDAVFFAIVGGAIYAVVRFTRKQFKIERGNPTRFQDIAGMDVIKRDMEQLVDLMKHPQEYEKRGIRQPHGILFAGTPGNGKTLFARALAGEAGVNFIAAKATDFQSMYMSIGPAKVKALFRKARRHAPCIIFIDEFDGIGEKRNYAGHAIDKENNRVITALLNELDGFERNDRGVLVIGATNNVKDLDPALIRAGRFDRKYIIGNPDLLAREQLIRMNLKDKKIGSDLEIGQLAMEFEGLSCAQIEAIINEAALIADAKNVQTVSQGDVKEARKRI